MSAEGIDAEVRSFLKDSVRSVHELEVLLLLRKGAARDWDEEAVARELRVSASSLRKCLGDFERRGLLERVEAVSGEAYRYAPRTGELAALVERAAEAYASRRVAVIGLIYEGPQDKIRSFAEAFRLRKEEKDG